MKPFQYYAAYGYYVARGAIPEILVRNLADRFYYEVKPCSEPLLRQHGRAEAHLFDAFGFMSVPLLDPHVSGNIKLDTFKNAVLDLACSQKMLVALRRITLRPEHSLQQIMVFEQAATPAHQDWVYLDSFPPGFLTAAWVALEDIDPAASRFFIVPGSQDFEREFPSDWIVGSSRYVDAMAEVLRREYVDNISILDMRAGDVLFWNSRVIHGSLPGSDGSKSRLSLTAHYVPDGFGFGNRAHPLMQSPPLDLVQGRPIPFLNKTTVA